MILSSSIKQQQPSPCELSFGQDPLVVRFHPIFQQRQQSIHAYHACELSTQESYTSANYYALLFLTSDAMNWTGGRLQRHSTRADNIKHLQKQHFARVQQGLRGAPKVKSPIKWSLFDRIAEDREHSQREQPVQLYGNLSHREKREESGQTFGGQNGHAFTAPAVRKVESGKPWTIPVQHGHQHTSDTYNSAKVDRVPDDDIYNATPPPRNIKPELRNSKPLAEEKNLVEEEEEQGESMWEKRRRLLRRGDWVGTSISKPLQIKFASQREQENVGRRRKLPRDCPLARYETRQSHITSPFAQRVRCPADIAPSTWARQQAMEAEQERADVRISIGGRVIPPGLSSNSALYAITRHQSQATPSDVMLLDNRESSQVREDQSSISGNQQNNQLYIKHNYDSQAVADDDQPFSPYKTISNRRRASNHDSSQAWADMPTVSDGGAQETVHRRDIRPHQKQQHIVDQTPTTNRKFASSSDVHSSLHPAKTIFSSSSASIHHPKPQSSRVSLLLRSGSSDIAASTAAQVGRRQPAVPAKQIFENEVWESRMAPLHGGQESANNTSDAEHRDFNISPGISEVPIRQWFEPLSSSPKADVGSANLVDDVGEEASIPMEVEDSAHEGAESEGSVEEPRTRRIVYEGSDQYLDSSNPCHENFGREKRAGASPVGQHIAIPTEAKNPSPLPQEEIITPKQHDLGPDQEDDTDDLWRKFVFGSSSTKHDESDPASPTADCKDVDQPRNPQSSMLVHSGTRQSIDSTWKTGSIVIETPTHVSESNPTTSIQTTEDDIQHGTYSASSASPRQKAASSSSENVSDSVPVCAGPDRSSFGQLPRRQTYFTKPEPFVGRRRTGQLREEEPLHIGRKLGVNGGSGKSRSANKAYRSVFPDDEGEVESIEDD